MELLNSKFHKYFKYSEFDSPDKPGSGYSMKVPFLNELLEARELSNVPYVITSGFRTKERNNKVGGVNDSAHTLGWAADIATTTSTQRFFILKGLLDAGFTRIGIGRTFIHVDMDPTKPPNVIWDYYK